MQIHAKMLVFYTVWRKTRSSLPRFGTGKRIFERVRPIRSGLDQGRVFLRSLWTA